MVIPMRFERTTYRLGICRSILLSYGIAGFSYRGKPGGFEDRPVSSVRERLSKVGNQVFRRLDAHGETHESVGKADAGAHVCRDGRMRG